MIDNLEELAAMLCGARAFVGADSGPAHLAAQLGVPTLALFGPTDPAIWAPIGPRVRVLSPATPCGMDWLGVARVAGELRRFEDDDGPALSPP
jgi:hypothetical protein